MPARRQPARQSFGSRAYAGVADAAGGSLCAWSPGVAGEPPARLDIAGRAGRSSLARSVLKSISYCVPSSPKRTVAASGFPRTRCTRQRCSTSRSRRGNYPCNLSQRGGSHLIAIPGTKTGAVMSAWCDNCGVAASPHDVTCGSCGHKHVIPAPARSLVRASTLKRALAAGSLNHWPLGRACAEAFRPEWTSGQPPAAPSRLAILQSRPSAEMSA